MQDSIPVRCVTGVLSWLVTQGDTLQDFLPVRCVTGVLSWLVTQGDTLCQIPYL